MTRTAVCPICKKPAATRPENRAFPFCSDRCRLLDLSHWLGETYRVPGPSFGDVEGTDRPASPESAGEGDAEHDG